MTKLQKNTLMEKFYKIIYLMHIVWYYLIFMCCVDKCQHFERMLKKYTANSNVKKCRKVSYKKIS